MTDAYGWHADLPEEAIVERLVALNAQRRDEESSGVFRWLRKDYQVDTLGPLAHRADRVQSFSAAAAAGERAALPRSGRERARDVLGALERAAAPVSLEEIAIAYDASAQTVAPLRETVASLVALGSVAALEDGRILRAGT